MECPHCKKTIELEVVGERPWWKKSGCLVMLLLLVLFMINSIFFADRMGATKEDTNRLERRLEGLEQMMKDINQKLDKEPPKEKNQP